jgi:hypothetical protein
MGHVGDRISGKETEGSGIQVKRGNLERGQILGTKIQGTGLQVGRYWDRIPDKGREGTGC